MVNARNIMALHTHTHTNLLNANKIAFVLAILQNKYSKLKANKLA